MVIKKKQFQNRSHRLEEHYIVIIVCLLKVKKLQLSVDIQCHLFDHLILPIYLYGSEIWGYEDISQIEVLHRTFLRTILFVNKSMHTRLYGLWGDRTRADFESC